MPAGSTFVGLQLVAGKDMTHIAKRVYLERVIEHYLAYTGQADFFTITMPCGEQYVFNDKNFPSEIMMCRCGDPRHIVVLWRSPEGM